MPTEELFFRVDLKDQFASKDVFSFIAGLEGKEYRALEYRRTIATVLDGKRYFVKHHKGSGITEILKNLLQFRMPVISARNEWLALSRLNELGIAVPRIAAYGLRGWLPQKCESFIVTEDVGTQRNLEDLTRDWNNKPPLFAVKLALIKELAGISHQMHSHGICHRDFYICHFLLSEQGSNRLTLIDLHRALVKENLGERWLIKDIGSLYFSAMDIGLTQRDLLRFIRFYSGLSLKEALRKKRSFWGAVQKRAEKLERRHS